MQRKGNVAELYPAHQHADGRVWFKGTRRPEDKTDQWGWTCDPAQAHPDYNIEQEDGLLTWRGSEGLGAKTCQHDPTDGCYLCCRECNYDRHRCPGCGEPQNHGAPVCAQCRIDYELDQPTTIEENTEMTAITDDGDFAGRTTDWMNYPLPPEMPRAKSEFGRWGYYKLPHPETGRPTDYPRATTIAKTLDDESNLAKWRTRQIVTAIMALADMPADAPAGVLEGYTAGKLLGDLRSSISGASKVTDVDNAITKLDNMMGGAEAREFGECVHAWLEALAGGIVLMRDVPEMVRPHVDAFHRVLARHGLIVLPQYVERTVLNLKCLDAEAGTGEGVAGKIDCILQVVSTGELVIGDIKTTKRDSIKFSWLTWGCQIGGVYGWADLMLAPDGKGWETMPEVAEDYAIVLSVPSDHPEDAAALTMNKEFGGETLMDSIGVRSLRKRAKTEVPRFAIPAPTKESLRYVEARQALSRITSPEDGNAVYESFEDVWDADLDQFAEKIAELL